MLLPHLQTMFKILNTSWIFCHLVITSSSLERNWRKYVNEYYCIAAIDLMLLLPFIMEGVRIMSRTNQKLEETKIVVTKVHSELLKLGESDEVIADVTGLNPYFLKNLRYGKYDTHYPNGKYVIDYGAPRYDRVLKLLAYAHFPHELLLVDGKINEEVMNDLTEFCLLPIREVAMVKSISKNLNTIEKIYLPSTKILKRIVDQEYPQLDVIVRLLKYGALSIDQLAPSMDDNENAEKLIEHGFTEENSQPFFATLKALFSTE